MEFLAKHYEKLILAFALVCLLFVIFVVSMSFKDTEVKLKEELNAAKRNVTGGEMVEKFSRGDYNIDKYLEDSRKYVNILGDRTAESPKGSLIEPNRYIVCKDCDKCHYLIMLSDDKCPFCGKVQPELAKETDGGDDTDEDGIPDKVEELAGMNYRDPKDARQDIDGDGFLNIEEFKEGTEIDNPDSFPCLAGILRTLKVYRKKIPLKLLEVDSTSGDDPAKWDIILMAYDVKSRKIKRQSFLIGDKISGYVILKASKKGDGDNAEYFVSIAPLKDKSDVYVLEIGKDIYAKKLTANMLYMVSREYSNASQLMRSYSFSKDEGDEFQLAKDKEGEIYKEYFKLGTCTEEGCIAKVALLKDEHGEVLKEFQLKKFNPKEDFINADRGNGFNSERMMPKGNQRMPAGNRNRGF